MRKKRLFYNTIASLADQGIVMLCAIILPKFFLEYYGSAVNGLVSSITQFLSFIAFLDLGVGAVVQSTLYKPLAENSREDISKILSSARKFFRKIARIFVIYIIILVALYPTLIAKQYGFLYTAALIGSIAITQFAQYYFGIVNQLLLSADQKSYIQMALNSIVLILNTVVCILLIKLNFSIQLVKLFSSLVFLLKPIGMWLYVKQHYDINYRIQYDGEPIKQKWNGLAQHVTAVVLDNTDIALLTFFTTLENVSIYSVYYLVVHGIRKILERFSTGMQSLLGDLYARNEHDRLNKVFGHFEFLIHTGVVFLFTCTGILLVPFVMVYTLGVNDANYNVPLFGIILTMSQAAYCLRVPYNMMVKAAGHYKETQTSAVIEMIINIVISVLTVVKFGLIGVAIGTLCAMLYRTLYLVIYSYKNLLHRHRTELIKQFFVDAIEVSLIVIMCHKIHINQFTFIAWIRMAVPVAICSMLVIGVVSIIMYRNEMIKFFKKN